MERMIDGIEVLKKMEELRLTMENRSERPDYIIRLCEAIVADACGFNCRVDWSTLQLSN